jgi:hypothetical protein
MSSAVENTIHSARKARADSWSIDCSCFSYLLSPMYCYCIAVLGIHCLINSKFLFFDIDFMNEAVAKALLAFFSLVWKIKAYQYL